MFECPQLLSWAQCLPHMQMPLSRGRYPDYHWHLSGTMLEPRSNPETHQFHMGSSLDFTLCIETSCEWCDRKEFLSIAKHWNGSYCFFSLGLNTFSGAIITRLTDTPNIPVIYADAPDKLKSLILKFIVISQIWEHSNNHCNHWLNYLNVQLRCIKWMYPKSSQWKPSGNANANANAQYKFDHYSFLFHLKLPLLWHNTLNFLCCYDTLY